MGHRERSSSIARAEDVTRPDRTVDVIVVGSGAAGHAAALSATAEGAEVLLVEKLDRPGGTTGKSGGWYWVPNNLEMQALGIEDPREDALRYMARLTRPEAYDPDDAHLGLRPWEHGLIAAFYDHAATAVAALVESGALESVHAREFPDYFAQLPENKAPSGRVYIPATPDGEMGTGADMIVQLSAAAERAGVTTLLGHAVQQLLVDDDGRAAGVVVGHAGGTAAFAARRAVIFASGGFAQDRDLRRELLAGPIFGTCAAPGSTGDFLRIATELGLPARATGYPWMSPAVLERALRNRADLEMTFQATGDSMIEVNRMGVRATNEKLQYNEQTLVHWEWDAQRAEYRNLLLFMIWDQPCQDAYASDLPGNPIAPEGGDDEHVLRAETLTELAAALGERLGALASQTGGFALDEGFAARLPHTIARFNEQARSGVDSDFHRGETPIETFFNAFHGEVRNPDSPTMHAFAGEGPYYATIIAPGMLDSKGGPVIDPSGRVLDAGGDPVPGLYGAGNCVASPSGKAYWAGGATIGPALTFGWLAGKAAAQEAPRSAPPTIPAATGIGL
ncbi:MAG: 3-oxosteroid 1-dehydrogenase [Baekduia sp.]|nr:3-oxosteroid 1-dehydrogenase [Baekduia sp.]